MNPLMPSPLNFFQSFIYGVIVAVTFGAFGFYFEFAYPTIQAEFLKTACVLIGVVWGFSIHVYNKLFELTELSGLSSRQHENLESVIHSRLKHFWLRAFAIGILGMVAVFPSITKNADGPACKVTCIYNSTQVYLAYAALGIAVFMLIRLLIAQEEIRRVSSKIKQDEREAFEIAQSLKGLS